MTGYDSLFYAGKPHHLLGERALLLFAGAMLRTLSSYSLLGGVGVVKRERNRPEQRCNWLFDVLMRSLRGKGRMHGDVAISFHFKLNRVKASFGLKNKPFLSSHSPSFASF